MKDGIHPKYQDAKIICAIENAHSKKQNQAKTPRARLVLFNFITDPPYHFQVFRSEEHTSELQSQR